MTELYAALQPVLDEHSNYHQQQSEAEQEDAGSERPVQLAIMGLPNVASSSDLVPDPPPPPPPHTSWPFLHPSCCLLGVLPSSYLNHLARQLLTSGSA